MDTTDVATSLRIMVGGDDRVSRYLDPATNEDYDVQLRLDMQYRSDPDTISRLYVPSQAGGLVRLDNVVRIEEGQAASRIERLDRQRTVRFFAGVGPGYLRPRGGHAASGPGHGTPGPRSDGPSPSS